jgi:hypothetical protein
MPPLAAVPDLERELDGLYALPLEEFTKARNDLAARLKKAHQTEAADLVRALKKPSVVAWAANRVARMHPDLVGVVVDAAGHLREVQQRALGGKASQAELGEATARERDAIRSLVTAARGELGGRGTAPMLDRRSQTFPAAAVEPELARLLAAGRLTEELQAIGFGPLEAVEPRRRREPDEVRRAARERVTALRAEARRLAHEAREAEGAARDADQEAARLHEEAEEKQREAERAAAELAEAEETLRQRKER